jgi:hypothetical protein
MMQGGKAAAHAHFESPLPPDHSQSLLVTIIRFCGVMESKHPFAAIPTMLCIAGTLKAASPNTAGRLAKLLL